MQQATLHRETGLEGVLLDALGTLVELEPPAPHLAAELRDRFGLEIAEEDALRAFGEEMRYYRGHHLEARDAASLEDLRRRSAAVLHASLPSNVQARVAVDELLPAMLAALRFRPYPEVPEALAELRAAGLKLAVVSNWDISLEPVLERIGLADRLDGVFTSTAAGAAKPVPRVFERALEALGLSPAEVVHVGDSPGLDDLGAIAAGIDPILVIRDDRDRRSYAGPAPVLPRLDPAAILRSRAWPRTPRASRPDRPGP